MKLATGVGRQTFQSRGCMTHTHTHTQLDSLCVRLTLACTSNTWLLLLISLQTQTAIELALEAAAAMESVEAVEATVQAESAFSHQSSKWLLLLLLLTHVAGCTSMMRKSHSWESRAESESGISWAESWLWLDLLAGGGQRTKLKSSKSMNELIVLTQPVCEYRSLCVCVVCIRLTQNAWAKRWTLSLSLSLSAVEQATDWLLASSALNARATHTTHNTSCSQCN